VDVDKMMERLAGKVLCVTSATPSVRDFQEVVAALHRAGLRAVLEALSKKYDAGWQDRDDAEDELCIAWDALAAMSKETSDVDD